jgi:hypothetical protein
LIFPIEWHQTQMIILNSRRFDRSFKPCPNAWKRVLEKSQVIKRILAIHQLSTFLKFSILYRMACSRDLHHFSVLSYLDFKQRSIRYFPNEILKSKLRVRDLIFFSKCSPFSPEYSHIIRSAAFFLAFSEKYLLVDQSVPKPWFSRKPTSEHFRQKCPLDKRKSVV